MGQLLLVTIIAALVVTLVTGAPVAAQLRRHPRGLYVLFATEMWERFSYYGLRTLLILYLTQHMLLDDGQAAAVYGGYTTLVYLAPMIGGLVADRIVGLRRAVAFGAVLLVAGHALMTVEGRPASEVLEAQGRTYPVQVVDHAPMLRLADGVHALRALPDGGLAVVGAKAGGPAPARLAAGSYRFKVVDRDNVALGCLYAALALVAMGVGFLKPNISSLVGRLYPDGDPRRDAGYTLYYYGINLGSFWATLLCAVIGQTVGWWAGFGLAALGMTAGLVIFLLGQSWLPETAAPAREAAPGRRLQARWAYLGVLAVVPLFWLLLQHSAWIGALLGAGALGAFAYVSVHAARHCTPDQRKGLLRILVLLLGAVVFFTLLEQAGSSMNLFADRNVRMPGASLPGLGAFRMTPAMAQSFSPGFVLLFAPLIAAAWTWMERRGRHLDANLKFALGLAQAGLGFLVLAASAGFHDAGFQTPLLFLAAAYALHSSGELCLSPVGMAEISRLSPPVLLGTLMAAWFVATASAEYVGGFLARMAGSETVAGLALDPARALAASTHVFALMGWAGVAAGLVFLAIGLAAGRARQAA